MWGVRGLEEVSEEVMFDQRPKMTGERTFLRRASEIQQSWYKMRSEEELGPGTLSLDGGKVFSSYIRCDGKLLEGFEQEWHNVMKRKTSLSALRHVASQSFVLLTLFLIVDCLCWKTSHRQPQITGFLRLERWRRRDFTTEGECRPSTSSAFSK